MQSRRPLSLPSCLASPRNSEIARTAPTRRPARVQLNFAMKPRCGLVAELALLFQQPRDDTLPFRRYYRLDGDGRLLEDLCKGHCRGGSLEWAASGGDLVENHAQRPQVGAGIHKLAACLFWRHVG